MAADYLINRLREQVERDYVPGRERSLVITKLDEAQLWLLRCQPTPEAFQRDDKPQESP